jgi:hypothetical protein
LPDIGSSRSISAGTARASSARADIHLIATQAVIRPERAGEAPGVTKTVITVAAGLGVGLAGAITGQDREWAQERPPTRHC